MVSLGGDRVRGGEQALLERARDRGDQPAGALEARARRAQVTIQVKRTVELDLERVDAVLRPAVAADDIAARIRRVAGGAIAEPLGGAHRRLEQIGRRRGAVAIAEDDARGAGAAAFRARPRRHRMAIEEDRGAEPRRGGAERRFERGVIGAVDPLDPPVELAALDPLAPDRAEAGDPRRDQADAAAGAR